MSPAVRRARVGAVTPAKPVILVVDDDPSIREMMPVVLADVGTVRVAGTAAEGLAQARASRPAIVIVDYRLPDMRGDDLVAALRADPVTGRTPIIMMTGDPAYRGDDADVFLLKPFGVDALTDAVRALLASVSRAADPPRR